MPFDKSKIVAKAREYVGTPFHHQGRLKGVGVDCIGLVVCTYRDLELSHKDSLGYSKFPDGKTLEAGLTQSLDRIPVEEAVPGDVLVFRMRAHPCHIGIKTDHGVIHTYAGLGKVVEHRIDDFWQRRLCAAYRLRGT
jgi:NlpC/P60 family putative phage cell wall peptidase